MEAIISRRLVWYCNQSRGQSPPYACHFIKVIASLRRHCLPCLFVNFLTFPVQILPLGEENIKLWCCCLIRNPVPGSMQRLLISYYVLKNLSVSSSYFFFSGGGTWTAIMIEKYDTWELLLLDCLICQ